MSVIGSFETALFGAPVTHLPSSHSVSVVSPAQSTDESDATAVGSGNVSGGGRGTELNDVYHSESVEDTDIAGVFVNEWLGAIVDTIVGLFVAQVLQLDSVRPQGAAQLCVDIDYFRYVHSRRY